MVRTMQKDSTTNFGFEEIPAAEKQGRVGSAGGRRRRGRPSVTSSLAEINVVPLVDVMLVLLIVFMVAAPLMQRGMDVSLPVSTRADPVSADRLVVTVPMSFRTDQIVQVDGEPVLRHGKAVSASFDQTIDRIYGKFADEVRKAFRRYVRSMPLAAITDRR